MSDRHHQVSRIEGFSDAVFGFALTLLVVSLEVPRELDALKELLKGSVAFALTFAMVCWIWWEHNKFFRRYGLQDAWTAFLNSFLLFVVLFYVYPLKFLTSSLMNRWYGIGSEMRMGDGYFIMLLYSSGVFLIFGTFVLFYQHAWRQRRKLDLSQKEEIMLRYGKRAHMMSAALALLSITMVLVNARWAGIAGMIYGLMGPIYGVNGYRLGVALEKAEKGVNA